MNTIQRLQEARDILESLLAKRGSSVLLVRAHGLLDTAISELFQDPDDTVALGPNFPDEDELVGELYPKPPFPAA
jgi:hypothetical protein